MLNAIAHGDEATTGHKLTHRLFRIIRKSHVPVGQYADQLTTAFGDDGYAGNFIFIHQM